jgi:hypothetical protein
MKALFAEIQDYLAPRLDSYEQMLYHYLFRHSRLEGQREVTVGVRTLQTRVGLGIGKAGSPPSQSKITEKLRSLERKGCIRILERSRVGTRVEVLIPREVLGLIEEARNVALHDLDSLDFFNNPELRLAIFEREKGRCFYCMKVIERTNFTLDHVMPQSGVVQNHSYKNVAGCCFECNSRKQAKDAQDFLRQIYREGLLTTEEHRARVDSLQALMSGKLIPDL